MSATAEETSQQSSAVAAASEQATRNVQTVAGAAEELAASIAEIGQPVTQSNRISGRAVEQADHTNPRVEGLAAAPQRIAGVGHLIPQLAQHTNILALTATLEARRADARGQEKGDHSGGKRGVR